jgi:uncharacterized RDD family membrane protein YckC
MYCEHCGAELKEGTVYCPNCGTPVRGAQRQIELATWGQRLVAIIIDWIILGIITGILRFPISSPSWFGSSSVIGFLYFAALDYYYEQTIGRRAMNIKITRIGGDALTPLEAVLESFGKAFILPLDFLIGYFLYGSRNQRLFNHLSDTVVVRAEYP